MPSRQETKKVLHAFLDADDLVFLITGRRIKNLVTRGLDLFGNDVQKKFTGEEPKVEDPDDPYNILGVRSTASDIVVKAVFRSLAREYHPDTGTKPDPSAFQRAKEAYDKIVQERH